MRLDHNRICTWNSEVEAGNTYLYTEGNLECKVKLIQTNQEREGVSLRLKIIDKPGNSPMILGEEFEVMAIWNKHEAGRWWYLHDPELVRF